MSNKYLLSRDDLYIRAKQGSLRDQIEEMNVWLQWFNSLAYVEKITTLEGAKEFLSNTRQYHECHVITFLKSKCDGELPPNTEPLRLAWLISDCDNVNFLNFSAWNHLQFENEKLSVPASVFTEIEEKYCIYATSKEEKQLVDRIYKFVAELEYFTPKNKDSILIDADIFNMTSKGLNLNLSKYYSLLNK